MRRLNGAPRGRRRDERGAVAIVTAMLVGGGLLLGCVALTVDVGSITSHRRELQNSADAVALAAAQTCATSASCPGAGDSGLAALADDNDPGSAVTNLCGSGGGLPACPAPDGTLSDCPVPSQSFSGSFVRAYTENDTALTFAPAIGADDTKEQSACAGVGWGSLGGYTASLPITFSVCEWQAAVGGSPLSGTGGDYAPPPPYPPYPDASYQHSVKLESKTDGACQTFNGHDAPGGFGWMTSGVNCQSQATTNGWIQVDTGNNVPNGCKGQIEAALGKVIYVPVYDCMNSVASMPSDPATQCSTGNGTHLYYHVAGFAAFYLTGWQLAGTSQNSIATGTPACASGEKCIQGYFVKDTVSGGQIGGSGNPGFGLTAIQMIG